MADNLNLSQAMLLTINVIDAALQHDQMGDFDDGKTIPDNPPKGYRFVDNAFRDFCRAIARTLSAAAGRKLELDDGFISGHFNGTMGVLASDVAAKLLAAPPRSNAPQMAALARKFTR